MTPGDFAGRVGVVTGGANGIGAGVARRLTAAGADVAIWDVDGPSAQAMADKISGQIASPGASPGPGRIIGIGCDVADHVSVEAALDRTRAEVGIPTLLVTAAGIMRLVGFLELDPGQWRRVLDVNLTGTFLCVQACARAMTEAGAPGSVVCISSVAGRGPRADAADYAASKAGVISLVRSAAVALAGYRITVNAVCPGVVETEMTERNAAQRARSTGNSAGDALRDLIGRIPLGRMQTVSDVADVVSFLLSPAASYVTGQALNACGGLEFD
jgi:NAD(P)-dependent dehydrogenase (short-subunit alcohol dehydrogenase family)